MATPLQQQVFTKKVDLATRLNRLQRFIEAEPASTVSDWWKLNNLYQLEDMVADMEARLN
jgi:hypothetical protein